MDQKERVWAVESVESARPFHVYIYIYTTKRVLKLQPVFSKTLLRSCSCNKVDK